MLSPIRALPERALVPSGEEPGIERSGVVRIGQQGAHIGRRLPQRRGERAPAPPSVGALPDPVSAPADVKGAGGRRIGNEAADRPGRQPLPRRGPALRPVLAAIDPAVGEGRIEGRRSSGVERQAVHPTPFGAGLHPPLRPARGRRARQRHGERQARPCCGQPSADYPAHRVPPAPGFGSLQLPPYESRVEGVRLGAGRDSVSAPGRPPLHDVCRARHASNLAQRRPCPRPARRACSRGCSSRYLPALRRAPRTVAPLPIGIRLSSRFRPARFLP